MRLLKWTFVFTLVSLAQGYAASVSPHLAELGWLVGTCISLCAGTLYGRRAPSRFNAAWAGAVAGGTPILVGCGLAVAIGPVSLSGLATAVAVGGTAGALGASLARVVQPARAHVGLTAAR